jgi:serine/threonine protein kinase
VEGYLEMSCPWCRHELRVRVAYVGKRVRCSYCRQVFGVADSDGLMPGSSDGPVESVEMVHDDPLTSEFAIPGYQLLGVLGDGSMGRVYKARQTRLERVVAVKVLRDLFARDPEYLRRFRLEAEVAARLSHANVVHVFDAGEVGGRPYIIMEYVEGENVQQRLERGIPFDERTAIEIALAVAAALAHAQYRGLVHRDIKPSNVMLARSGEVKLLDLGLARPIADAEWASAEKGNPIGTPEYISPEQVRGQVDVDIRSDIYALGATLYHMVTGRVLYSGTTVEVLLQHIDQSTRPVAPRDLNPKISPAFNALIKKMLAKNRDERYQTPDDLIDGLRLVQVAKRPHARPEDQSEVPPR